MSVLGKRSADDETKEVPCKKPRLLPYFVDVVPPDRVKTRYGYLMHFFSRTSVETLPWDMFMFATKVKCINPFTITVDDDTPAEFPWDVIVPYMDTNDLLLQFIHIQHRDSCHQTLMVFDTKNRNAMYFDSNGADAPTTPPLWRDLLKISVEEYGFHFKPVQAYPQGIEGEGSCSMWSLMGGMIMVQKYQNQQPLTLTHEDFENIAKDIPEKDPKKRLKKTMHGFMEGLFFLMNNEEFYHVYRQHVVLKSVKEKLEEAGFTDLPEENVIADVLDAENGDDIACVNNLLVTKSLELK